MRYAVPDAHSLKQHVEQSLMELEHERECIRIKLEAMGLDPTRWVELEQRVSLASAVAQKPTPAARRAIDSTLAEVRAFRATLLPY